MSDFEKGIKFDNRMIEGMVKRGLRPITDPEEIKRFQEEQDRILQEKVQRTLRLRRQRVYQRDSLYAGAAKSFTFDDWRPEMQQETQKAALLKQKARVIAEEMQTSNFNVAMLGGAGVGKTSMALAIVDKLKENKTFLFVSAPELAEVMRSQFKSEEQQERASHIERSMREVDILIIDDFGTEAKMSSRETEATDFIQRLYFRISEARQGKTTIITTNNTRPELVSMYNDKIISRMLTRDAAHQLNFSGLRDLRQV